MLILTLIHLVELALVLAPGLACGADVMIFGCAADLMMVEGGW